MALTTVEERRRHFEQDRLSNRLPLLVPSRERI
jgi:hypothetical protein